MLHLTIAFWLVASSLAAQDATPAFGRITGRVVVSGTGAPIAGAQVTLVPIGPVTRPSGVPALGGPPPQRVSDEDGRFVFASVFPGQYRVNVSKVGFAASTPAVPFGARRPPTVVTAGGVVDVGDLALERGGIVTGRVLGADGEPVPDAHVRAMRRVPNPEGRPRMPAALPTGPIAPTNDLGEFRLFGLAAGEYVIAAAPPFAGGALATSSRTVQTTKYFPSATDISGATSVAVTASAETNGIEIRLARVPAFRVSGVVVDPSGQPIAGAMVTLMHTTPSAPGGPRGSVRTRQDGQFLINGVVAGAYRAVAAIPTQTFDSVNGSISGGFWVSSNDPNAIDVFVGDADVSGVRIVIQAR